MGTITDETVVINMGKGRSDHAKRARKRVLTSKLIDKITYKPDIHKNKFNKALRKKLQSQTPINDRAGREEQKTIIKFGSINVRGLDISAENAIHQLITDRKIDVRKDFFFYI